MPRSQRQSKWKWFEAQKTRLPTKRTIGATNGVPHCLVVNQTRVPEPFTKLFPLRHHLVQQSCQSSHCFVIQFLVPPPLEPRFVPQNSGSPRQESRVRVSEWSPEGPAVSSRRLMRRSPRSFYGAELLAREVVTHLYRHLSLVTARADRPALRATEAHCL